MSLSVVPPASNSDDRYIRFKEILELSDFKKTTLNDLKNKGELGDIKKIPSRNSRPHVSFPFHIVERVAQERGVAFPSFEDLVAYREKPETTETVTVTETPTPVVVEKHKPVVVEEKVERSSKRVGELEKENAELTSDLKVATLEKQHLVDKNEKLESKNTQLESDLEEQFAETERVSGAFLELQGKSKQLEETLTGQKAVEDNLRADIKETTKEKQEALIEAAAAKAHAEYLNLNTTRRFKRQENKARKKETKELERNEKIAAKADTDESPQQVPSDSDGDEKTSIWMRLKERGEALDADGTDLQHA